MLAQTPANIISKGLGRESAGRIMVVLQKSLVGFKVCVGCGHTAYLFEYGIMYNEVMYTRVETNESNFADIYCLQLV